MAAIKNVINNLFYTKIGKIIVSIIVGLGLASIFRHVCRGKDCYDFIGPKHSELKDQIFSYDSNNDKCFKLKEISGHCLKNKTTISFK